jgi:YVTN family beta-propeller protein
MTKLFGSLCVATVVLGTASLLVSAQSVGEADSVLVNKTDGRADRSNLPAAVGRPTFVSPHAAPIAISGGLVFVANTPADTVDVIDAATQEVIRRVRVGVDPVSVAVRPDGKEVWVSNHVSDSVSVIDSDSDSATFMSVVATVQQFDRKTKATRFDEPVGIAFANNEKAYVALSSENTIAVVDVATRKVVKRLSLNAQDPRAIVVRDEKLYVIPFESNNQTQLSGGTGKIDGDLVTFDAHKHAIENNNVLSIGAVMDIVKHPKVPDRDLYIFDTNTDKLVDVIDSLGTLLYGITVDSTGRVFVAQTDARNDANGRAGTKKHGLAELDNRAFLNRITTVGSDEEHAVGFIDLEPLPPEQPRPDEALATPFAIQISDDDSTLVVSAAGSDKLFTVDAESGEVLGRVQTDAVPRGIALENSESGEASVAWVLNAVANTVSMVDVSDFKNPSVVKAISLEDPTHPDVKRGRIAFNTASASSTKTFACASCHPDGHTDQLLWVLKTPIVSGGNQIMPRSTMPVRGLRDTQPYHWDGIPGDPYGGNNSAKVHGSVAPNSDIDDPISSVRHLIDGGMASTMSLTDDETKNDEGKAGALTAAERDDMAAFLLSIPYPPAQRRSYTNELSDAAVRGFELFHIDGDHDRKAKPNVCGSCHRMPFLVSTNTPGTGMDAPTWRGAYDRWLLLPQGRLNIIDFNFYESIAERGTPEEKMWRLSWGGRRRFDPVWNMVVEGSTGYSGTFARQVTLNDATAGDSQVNDILAALEVSATENAVVLECDGMLIEDGQSTPLTLQFASGTYVSGQDGEKFSRDTLVRLASASKFVGTFTGRHGQNADVEDPQPALWTRGPIQKQSGRQKFPVLHESKKTMQISGRHIHDGANVIVDGRRVEGSVTVGQKDNLVIELAWLPSEGLHLLQVQNVNGMFSNDFIFNVTRNAKAARELIRTRDQQHRDWRTRLARAIAAGDVQETKNLRRIGVPLNRIRSGGNSTALSIAARVGNVEIVKYLLKHQADVNGRNRDGNTPLHTAAFFGRTEIVKLFLTRGADPMAKNKRGKTAVDTASAEWDEGQENAYKAISRAVGLEVDVDRVREARSEIAALLVEKADRD